MNPKVVLPIAAIGLALGGAAILVATSSNVEGTPRPRSLRAVRVAPVHTRRLTLSIRSQGTVSPRTESELIPEISGRVVWTSPSLVSGGYFDQDQPLLRIASEDPAATLEHARAGLERARGEDEHAGQALRRQQNLSERHVVSEAELSDARRAARVAAADLREARVSVEEAERDLRRTEIRAPFTGRVREVRVGVGIGQFMNRGQAYATLYATDSVEVRLPVADAQLAYLALPIWERHSIPPDQLPRVTLSARFAGRDRTWSGRIVRTEGEIDTKSRLVHVVARISNATDDQGIALPVGLFVQAEIAGRAAEHVAVIPRAALQAPGRVFVIDSQDRLRFRDVDVLRLEGDRALIRSGLVDGERVCVSPVQAAIDGMQVRPVETGPSAEDAA